MGEVSSIVAVFLLIAGGHMVKDISGTAVFGFGSCPKPTSKADFALTSYLGTWYEYERFNNWFERDLRCVFAQYTDKGRGRVGITNGGINVRTGQDTSIDGNARVVNPNRPAELRVSFSAFDFSRDANYIVLDTDYSTYALVFSCFDMPLLPVNVQTAWILTRARGVAPPNINALRERFDSEGIQSQRLNLIDQTNCN